MEQEDVTRWRHGLNRWGVGSSPNGAEIRFLGLSMSELCDGSFLSISRESALSLAAWIMAVSMPKDQEFEKVLAEVRGEPEFLVDRAIVSMITAQDDIELTDWIYGIIDGWPEPAGDFVRSVAYMAIRADFENYALVRPALLQLKARYPKYSRSAGPPRDTKTGL